MSERTLVAGLHSRRLVQDQSLVIFGGSSGLGKAVAIAVAQHGARTIVVADIDEEPREGGITTAEAVGRLVDEVNLEFISCDIREPEQVTQVFDRAEARTPTDAVINTAAVYWRRDLLETDIAEFENLFAVNVKGAVLVAQAAARHMIPRRRGVIINTGSGAGIRGSAGFSAYCASKGALRLLTHSLAAELGPYGLRVNQVDPASMDTTMTRTDVPRTATAGAQTTTALVPLRRDSRLDEVANAYVYLISPLASYVSGHCLAVDGGLFTVAPTLDPSSAARRTDSSDALPR